MINNAENRGQPQAWYRGKKVLIALTVIAAMLAISVYYIGAFLQPQKTQANAITRFSGRASSSNETFTLDVEVDLVNGMDRLEALEVAKAAFSRVSQIDPERKLVSFESRTFVQEDGVWVVEMNLIYRTDEVFRDSRLGDVETKFDHERFDVVIDPFNRTVVCPSS